MSAKDRNMKVKQFAKRMEDKALRQEYDLKAKRFPASVSHRMGRHRSLSIDNRRNESYHPMGKLNVSSVRAPSDMASLMASPPPAVKTKK